MKPHQISKRLRELAGQITDLPTILCNAADELDRMQRQQAIYDRIQARIDQNAQLAAEEDMQRRNFMAYLDSEIAKGETKQ